MPNPFQPKVTEHDIQASLFSYIEQHKYSFPQLETIFAIPNGMWIAGSGGRKFALINKYKSEGLTPGIPDVLLPLPSADGKWNLLFLETKRPNESLNPNQKKIHALFAKHKIRVEIWTDLLQAINYISSHLKIKLPMPR